MQNIISFTLVFLFVGYAACQSAAKQLKGCDNFLITGKHPERLTIKTSSAYPHCRNTSNYRLNAKDTGYTEGNGGGWCVGAEKIHSQDQYVELSLTNPHLFRGAATQGRQQLPAHSNVNQWVTKYRVNYSEDCVTFHTDGKIYSGNWDKDTLVIQLFDKPLIGKCIRINPYEYHGYMSMRFDIIGCKVNIIQSCRYQTEQFTELV